MSVLIARLNEYSIGHVVYIDDENASPVISTVDELIKIIVEAKPEKMSGLAAKHTILGEICAAKESLASKRAEEQRAVLQPMVEAIADKLDTDLLVGTAQFLLAGESEVSQKLKELFSAEGIEFSPWSFGKWCAEEGKLESHIQNEKRLLFIVDLVNKKEPTVDMDGKKLLKGLFVKDQALLEKIDCIIVTNECDAATEFATSQTLHDEIKTELGTRLPKQVLLMAKARLDAAQPETEFVTHVDRVEFMRLNKGLTHLVREKLGTALTEALDWLEDISLQDFHLSVVESSRREGASEIDTLMRLLSLKQRDALAQMMTKTSPVLSKIHALRRFTKKILEIGKAAEISPQLKEMRTAEFMRPPAEINALTSPLACGDVFSFESADGKVFNGMLLANPCDLALRSNGNRKLSFGYMIELQVGTHKDLTEKAAKDRNPPPLSCIFPAGNPEDQAFALWNARVNVVPLNILDLCWTNEEGKCSFDLSTLLASHRDLPVSQQKRLEHIAADVVADVYGVLNVGPLRLQPTKAAHEEVILSEIKLSSTASYNIKRIWRVSPDYASAALLAFSQSIARPGFAHDFTKH